VLGPLGALLAIPVTLLLKAVLVDSDPRARWVEALLGSEPTAPKDKKHLRNGHVPPTSEPALPAT
jgi:AI-2 transport protein TqsA